MPTPVTHLVLAEEILGGDALPSDVHRLLLQQHGPFLLGHTAPDVRTISGQPRRETHFYGVPLFSTPAPPLHPNGARPAHETLFAAHPELARADALPPAQAAFVAGYIAHLLLDELWLADVFWRCFMGDWGPLHERLFLHNVLRTWMDRQDQRCLNGHLDALLRDVKPAGWLPFVRDEDLRTWQDLLVQQLRPGRNVRTAEIFARQMGMSVADVEAVLRSPQQMEARVFARVSRAALQSFHDTGYRRSVELIKWYFGA